METMEDVSDRAAWLRVKILARLAYAGIGFAIALVFLLKHPAESFNDVAQDMVQFLKSIDLSSIFYRLIWRRNEFATKDWFGLGIICVGSVITYIWARSDDTRRRENEWWALAAGSILFSGIASTGIKYLLIGLVIVVGAFAGIVLTLAALIGSIEFILHLHEAGKSWYELKATVHEAQEDLKK